MKNAIKTGVKLGVIGAVSYLTCTLILIVTKHTCDILCKKIDEKANNDISEYVPKESEDTEEEDEDDDE